MFNRRKLRGLSHILVLHCFGVGSSPPPLSRGAEVENLFLSNSFCTRSSVFALFTNGHVDLVTGSESSTY